MRITEPSLIVYSCPNLTDSDCSFNQVPNIEAILSSQPSLMAHTLSYLSEDCTPL